MTNWNNGGRYTGGFPAKVKRQAQRALPRVCNGCDRSDVALTLDHIVPLAEGGTHTLSNAQWLCHPCHDRKTAAERARGQARRSAKRPAETHPMLLHANGTRDSTHDPQGR